MISIVSSLLFNTLAVMMDGVEAYPWFVSVMIDEYFADSSSKKLFAGFQTSVGSLSHVTVPYFTVYQIMIYITAAQV